MLQLTIKPPNPDHIELLAALFSDLLTEGLQVREDDLVVYVTEGELKDDHINTAIEDWQVQFKFEKQIKEVPRINWNEEWERNFEPVRIEDILTIKAHFHKVQAQTKYTITIQPKMSFGTGHHATTWMMVKVLSMLQVGGRKVLDVGTGTGILAILASMWQANYVLAFDNDEWSYENAIENLKDNPVSGHIEFQNATLSKIAGDDFDIVLANINKNFLLEEAGALASKMRFGGHLVISGFYDVDIKNLLDEYHALNLVAQYLIIRDTWACIVYSKKK